MKRFITAAALAALTFAAGGAASADEAAKAPEAVNADAAGRPSTAGLEAVESIPALRHLDSWSVIDDRNLIVWATPFDPYLVELWAPSPDLKWARTIGVTSFGSRIYAKFDSVKVGGFSYPIRGIYRLSRADAKERSTRNDS